MEETRHLIERARQASLKGQIAAERCHFRRQSQRLQQRYARVQGRVDGAGGNGIVFDRFSNHLLALLPTIELARLASQFQGVRLGAHQQLHRIGTPIDYVYFPTAGVISSRVVMQDGGSIEIAVVGNEGLVGLPVAVGGTYSPCDAVVLVPGEAMRIDAQALQEELKQPGLLARILTGYHDAYSMQTSMQVACSGLHSVRKRCCRQLLSLQDRLGTDTVPVTHEILSLELGVRRSSVTEELGLLQAEGAIINTRGQVRIVDRLKLTSFACECYQLVNRGYSRFFDSTGGRGNPLAPVG